MEVLNYDQCTGLDAGLTLIDYRALAGLRGGQVLPESDAVAEVGRTVVLAALSRGPQPTPGYGFTLNSITRTETTAEIQVTWREPPTDVVLARVVTHPCLVVALPRAGLDRIEAVDQAGSPIGNAAVR